MILDLTRRLQSLYVQVSDGVRLAVDVWLPVERIAADEAVGAVVRTTRYYRAEELARAGPEFDANWAEGELWNAAGLCRPPARAGQWGRDLRTPIHSAA